MKPPLRVEAKLTFGQNADKIISLLYRMTQNCKFLVSRQWDCLLLYVAHHPTMTWEIWKKFKPFHCQQRMESNNFLFNLRLNYMSREILDQNFDFLLNSFKIFFIFCFLFFFVGIKVIWWETVRSSISTLKHIIYY